MVSEERWRMMHALDYRTDLVVKEGTALMHAVSKGQKPV